MNEENGGKVQLMHPRTESKNRSEGGRGERERRDGEVCFCTTLEIENHQRKLWNLVFRLRNVLIRMHLDLFPLTETFNRSVL